MAKCYIDDLMCVGSIYKDRCKDIWTFKGSFIDSIGRKRNIKLSAKRRKELLMRVRMYIANFNKENSLKHITLMEWNNRYIQKISGHCRPTTIKTYSERMKYVLDKFGDYDISEIDTVELENFLNDLAKPLKGSADDINGTDSESDKIARSTVNSIIGYLRRCFKAAIKEKYITDNPAEDIERLEEEDPDTIALDADQAKILLKVAHEGKYIFNGIKSPKYYKPDVGTYYYIEQFYILILLLLSIGPRIGEALGLPWSNIDFNEKKIYIRQQLTYANGKPYISECLKGSGSYRDITIDDTLADALLNFKKYQQDYAELLGDKYIHREGLVFTNRTGDFVNQSGFRNRYFIKMIREAGLPENIGIHGLRRSTATILVDAGANIRAVADLLGHRSTRTLLDIYAKTTKKSKDAVAGIMSEQLKNSSNDQS